MYLVPPKHLITQSHGHTHTHTHTLMQQLGSGDWVCEGINALYLNNVQTVDKLQQTPAASENEQTVMCGKIRYVFFFFFFFCWNDCFAVSLCCHWKGSNPLPSTRQRENCFIFRLCLPQVSIIKDVCRMCTFILTEKNITNVGCKIYLNLMCKCNSSWFLISLCSVHLHLHNKSWLNLFVLLHGSGFIVAIVLCIRPDQKNKLNVFFVCFFEKERPFNVLLYDAYCFTAH